MELLLISNSTGPDGGYLDHCEEPLKKFLAGTANVLFVPFAGGDEPGYGALACERMELMGITAQWADRSGDPLEQLERADALFVGGGNTFRLLDRVYSTGFLEAIRRFVTDGRRYVGASAGTNIAGPTIMTTNDMPIVHPSSFEALGLVSFQINPHYVDRDPDSSHQGETRQQRLMEYLEENEGPVVALREGALLHVSDSRVSLGGTAGAIVFRRGHEPHHHVPGAQLHDLLTA